MLTHTGQQTYVCDYCSYKYINDCEVKPHNRFILEDNSSSNSVCGKTIFNFRHEDDQTATHVRSR